MDWLSTSFVLIILAALTIFGFFIATAKRYKRCPPDKVLVIYGRTNHGSAKCIHGNAAYVWPLLQDYDYLDLVPLRIEVKLDDALSKQNIRISIPASFTIGISTEEGVMQNAAERLLGLEAGQIAQLAQEIIIGQLRQVIATLTIEEINTDREKFTTKVREEIEAELKKIGLRLLNVNIKDLQDNAGYLEALGKEAAARAINDAKIKVAEQQRDGDTGEAIANKARRINVAVADADAVTGENNAKVTIAQSDANRRTEMAKAERDAITAERTAAAKAEQDSFVAEKEAEIARAGREAATQQANIIVPAQIAKEKLEIEAGANAEKAKLEAAGIGEAEYLKASGVARGVFELLSKRADGFEKMITVAGSAKNAAMLMVVDQIQEIVRLQVEAIKAIKIDKITVWDNMGNGNGIPTTANFMAGMIKALPPLQDILSQTGLSLPEYLVKPTTDTDNFVTENDSAVKDESPTV